MKTNGIRGGKKQEIINHQNGNNKRTKEIMKGKLKWNIKKMNKQNKERKEEKQT